MHLFSTIRYACVGILCAIPLVSQAAGTGTNSFNPSIGVILTGTYGQFGNDPANYALPGFALGEEVGPGEEGFGLGESELNISANVDDLFYGRFTAALSAENTVEIEESYLETIGLGGGVTVKFGRFLSGIGYLNHKHSHTWDFVDQPLAYKAMLGNQYKDDGIQLRWLVPTDLFFEVGVEAMRGENFPAGGAANDGKGVQSIFAHIGGDINDSHSWQAGASYLHAKANARQTGDPAETFSGNSNLAMLDFTWKWAPHGNSRETNFVMQLEYFMRSEDGTYQANPYNADQNGYYLQGIYQFMPRWRVGLRYDKLHADDPGTAFAGTALETQGHDPQRWSAMIDFSRTEFSRLRLQYNLDDSMPQSDHQLYLQYIMSLGAHGAHMF
ncbi:MAG: hypothetical protein PVG20_00290 [Thioalkalispiraceae bacterium]|jgi:hypothetical protein